MIKYDYYGDSPFVDSPTFKANQVQDYDRKNLYNDYCFCHGERCLGNDTTQMEPGFVAQFGINPIHSHFYATNPSGKQLGSGKMIWTFPAIYENNQWVPNLLHKKLWPSKYYYVFKASAKDNIEYWCSKTYNEDKFASTMSEIGFPYIIEPGDIIGVFIDDGKKYQKIPYDNTIESPTKSLGFARK